MTDTSGDTPSRAEGGRDEVGFGRALGVCVVWYIAVVVSALRFVGARLEDWFMYVLLSCPVCIALLVSLLLIEVLIRSTRLTSAVLIGTLAAAPLLRAVPLASYFVAE